MGQAPSTPNSTPGKREEGVNAGVSRGVGSISSYDSQGSGGSASHGMTASEIPLNTEEYLSMAGATAQRTGPAGAGTTTSMTGGSPSPAAYNLGTLAMHAARVHAAGGFPPASIVEGSTMPPTPTPSPLLAPHLLQMSTPLTTALVQQAAAAAAAVAVSASAVTAGTPPVAQSNLTSAPVYSAAAHQASAVATAAAAAAVAASAVANATTTVSTTGVAATPAASTPAPTTAAPSAPTTATAAATTTGTGAPSQTPQQHRTTHSYRHANIIPVWSKVLSSQALQPDGHRCSHTLAVPFRPVSITDMFAVLDLEVMKYVAYCGGLTLRFRLDEVPPNIGADHHVSWGILSAKPCPNLVIDPVEQCTQPYESLAPGASTFPSGDAGRLAVSYPGGRCISQPNTLIQVDNTARRSFHVVAGTSLSTFVSPGDIVSMEFAPQEGGRPYIKATLSINNAVVLQQCLPCASVSMVQLHPFVTLAPGTTVALYEAATPSPLFTWFPSLGGSMPDITMCELDTTIKYQATSASAGNAGNQVDFLGTTVFNSGRQRWTVQLDNAGSAPTYICVGVAQCRSNHATPGSAAGHVTNVLNATGVGVLRSLAAPAPGPSGPSGTAAGAPSASSSQVAAAVAGGSSSSMPSSSSNPSGRSSASQVAGLPSTSRAGASDSSAPPANAQWGAWIKLPGSNPDTASSLQPPPREGHFNQTEATSNHCYITIDLDLNAGFVRLFRNGHTIGTPFTGLAGPLCPVVSVVQNPGSNAQVSLVNITKLKQLDLTWAPDRCSADLQLAGPCVSKVSEVYGDYSTVLATEGFINGVHLWMVKINNLAEPDSIFIGVCRGCMPLDQDPQDLRDRTYYLSNGVVRVGGRRVATNAAQFTKGDLVTVVLDADQGEIVFFRNGLEQGRARGIRGRLFPFVSCDTEGDQVTLVASYSLRLDRIPRTLADMEWDTLNHAPDVELSSNCLTATKTGSNQPSTVKGSIVYKGKGRHEFHVILDTIGPDGVWVGVAPADIDPHAIVGDEGCGWALHSDGDKRYGGREEEYTAAFKNGDVLTVVLDLSKGTLCFNRNGIPLGEAFTGVTGNVVPCATLASEEAKITIQNRPTVLNTGAYVGDLRWDETRAGRDLTVLDGLTVSKMGNDGGDYATVLGTLCLASGQHSWNVYINHVEDSNLFIGVTVGGHDLNADPQEMKHRTYYLSNGTIRVAGKLVTRCAEPYAEGDLVTVQLDMDARNVQFLKNGVMQGCGDGLPEEVWPYVSLDNVMDSVTLHSSSMFMDLVQSLRWNAAKACRMVTLAPDGSSAQLRGMGMEETIGQGTVLGLREYSKTESHTWVVKLEQATPAPVANFLVGVAPPGMDLNKSLGEENCGIGLDLYGYFYVNGRYFHVSNLAHWKECSKPVRGSTAKHKGKTQPVFNFTDGKCEVTLTLDLKEKTLRFSHGGRSIGIISDVTGPLHAAITLTSSRQKASLNPGPIGRSEHTNEELVNIIKGKGVALTAKMEAALLAVPREVFVPRDRQREAFRDQKVTVRTADGSTMTLPPPSFVATALDKLGVGTSGVRSFLDVGAGTAYVAAIAACVIGETPDSIVHGIECVNSRLESACANMRVLKERICQVALPDAIHGAATALSKVELSLANVLIPECTNGVTYDALYCDVVVSEEELPMLLSLVKPGGRMVCLIEEEAVLFIRGSQDPHDYQREVIQQLQGEYGSLDEPTPWEVQEAISRIKERERKRGHDQAKQDAASLRTFEYVEMQQRVQAAMKRIAELEAQVQRQNDMQQQQQQQFPSNLVVPPLGLSFGLRSPAGPASYEARSPGHVTADDVRGALKDKERRGVAVVKPSPRGSFSYASPIPSPGLNDSADWKAMYTTNTAGDGFSSPRPGSAAKQRMRELFSEQDQSAGHVPGFDQAVGDAGLIDDVDEGDDEDYEAMLAERAMHMQFESTSPMVPLPFLMGPSNHIHMAHHVVENIIDSISVQTFTPEQIQIMIAGSTAVQIENRDVYQGTYKGVRVRVWCVNVCHGVSYLELKRAYSRYCIAHPNIAAVLGVCIQPITSSSNSSTLTSSLSTLNPTGQQSAGPSSPEHVRRCVSMPAPSPLSKCTYARAVHDASCANLRTGDSSTHDSVSGFDDAERGSAPDTQSLFEEDEISSNHGGGSGVHHLSAHLRTPERPQSSVPQKHMLWVVEESFGDESLLSRLERGMLSWQQACRISTDICKALAFLQDLKRHSDQQEHGTAGNAQDLQSPSREDSQANLSTRGSTGSSAVLSAYAMRTIVTPANVQVNAQSTKVSVLPALLHHLETVAEVLPSATLQSTVAPLHCDMAYIDPHTFLNGENSSPSLYAYGIVQLQLLTEQGPLGLLSAVKEALETRTLMNLVPRLPVNTEMAAWATDFAHMAIKCIQPGGAVSLETELLPALEALAKRLGNLGSSMAMSWEQVEEMLMLPLQPRTSGESNRRWVRQDFRVRRKLFMEEVAKLAVEGPIHRIEVRRGRCFKDSANVFAGKGHTVWKQPLKVTFLGEQGMDSGGVTREWFSALSNSISRGSPELFWAVGPQKNQLYINPLSSSPSHLKKFQFVGMFMAKAILESSARGKELGPITLNLPFCEPLWKLLLGAPLNLMDLQLLDPTEFRSLMSLLDMDIDGLIFETFSWEFHQQALPAPTNVSGAGFGVGLGYVAPDANAPNPHHRQEGGQPSTPRGNGHASATATPAATPPRPQSGEGNDGAANITPGSSSHHAAHPHAHAGGFMSSPGPHRGHHNDHHHGHGSNNSSHANQAVSIPLKPGGVHLKVTNHNKREYVLLKAHKMLVGTIEAQMGSMIDAFHSIIPRELLDKYQFTSMEMQLLVCGEQRIDVQDLQRNCKYEDGYTGKEPIISWFWQVVEGFDDSLRRKLLQFWSGSDGMPAEGFAAMDPAFHMVAVERLYDPADTTARLPAAHTCFRQLDLPRYKSMEELKEKLITAITIGAGYMALS